MILIRVPYRSIGNVLLTYRSVGILPVATPLEKMPFSLVVVVVHAFNPSI